MDTLPDGARPLTLTATLAGNADTRATVDGDWDGGEKVALQVDAGNYYDYTVIDQDGRMTGNYNWQDGENVNIQGFCPSDKIKDNQVCSVETDQSIDSNYYNSDLLCSTTESVSKENPYNMLAFYHQTAKIVVNVKNSGYLSGGTNGKISMAIGGTDGIYTSATFSKPIFVDSETLLWTGKWTNLGDKKPITPHKATTASGCVATFEALVIPQTVSAGTTLFQFNVGDVGPFRYTVPTGSSIKWDIRTMYTYNVTLNNTTSTRSAGTPECVLELVETRDMNGE